MRFMMIVKANKDSEAGKMPSEELLAAMAQYNEELVNAGVLVDLAGLQSSAKGFRARFSGGKTSIIDGPFPETKELVAGYWIIIPTVLGQLLGDKDPQRAKRAMQAMLQMTKIDINKLQQAAAETNSTATAG